MDCHIGVVGGVSVDSVFIVVHVVIAVNNVIADVVGQVSDIIRAGAGGGAESAAPRAGNGDKVCDG